LPVYGNAAGTARQPLETDGKMGYTR
jgi:hypothetical protein